MGGLDSKQVKESSISLRDGGDGRRAHRLYRHTTAFTEASKFENKYCSLVILKIAKEYLLFYASD